MKHVVKRAGHSEAYDERKLYASLYAAALSVRTPEPTAELIAQRVVGYVEDWLQAKHEVTSNDIRRVAGKHLHDFHPDAAYQYLHHRVMW